MKQEELDNLDKNQLLALIKTKHANKAIKELINTVVLTIILLVLAVYMINRNEITIAFSVFSISTLICCLIDYSKVKKTSKIDNVGDMLNWYDYLFTKKRKRWNQGLACIPALAVGFAFGALLHELQIREFDDSSYILVCLLLITAIVYLVLILVSKTKGLEYFKEKYVDRLRELVKAE